MIMLDEKKIEEVAHGYSKTLRENQTLSFAYRDFKAGAHWAIEQFLKDLWHNASEEPKGYNEWILLYYSTGNFLSVHQVKDFVNWKKFVEFAPFKQWAYLDDLFE